MEAAIRWSPHATQAQQQFLIVDVQANRLQLCQVEDIGKDSVTYRRLSRREKLPNYTAFDWSKTQPHLVALGAQSGEASLVRIDAEHQEDPIISFPIRVPRKCNSIAFSTKDYLVTGLDRVRNDHCMNVYDLKSVNPTGGRATEPYRKLASSEPISSIKFFASQPETLIYGVPRQCIRLFDIRDNNASSAQFFTTRQVHNLAIDPLDENYFISAGPAGEPIVSVWDRRMASRSTPSTPSSENGPSGPVIEMRPAVESSHNANIWALRFSGTKRGCFGVLSSSGEVKIVETSQHAARSSTMEPVPGNNYGGGSWSSRMYVKRTHHLTYPTHDEHNGRDEHARIIGFDFIPPGVLPESVGLFGLHPDRSIEPMTIPNVPRQLRFTNLDEIYTDGYLKRPPNLKPGGPAVARDLEDLQDKARTSKVVLEASREAGKLTEARLGQLSMEVWSHKAPPTYETPLLPSSGDKHEKLLTLWFPPYQPNIEDALNVLRVQRRRCFEGYQLNPQRNKEIVSNDPWLVDMWETIKRFGDMARSGGMIVSDLDLSYLGVYGIWNNTYGGSRNRNLDNSPVTTSRFISAVAAIVEEKKDYPSFQGHKTKFPAHRQLSLALCGWAFTKDRLRHFCRRLMDNKQYYKAIVIAVMRGFKDLAQELLRAAIKDHDLRNIGLGAVIACESVNSEQRELCEWMAEETDDPYLKALLNYFIKGDWKIVADMPELALSDRVGVALKYLDDKRLDEFIKIRTQEAMLIGNIEGLVLTGLSDQAMTLFSNYIKKFNDLQTAVLAMSFTCPLYNDDQRFEAWKDTYVSQLQMWRAYNERSKYLEAHVQISKTSDGRLFGKVDDRPTALRCPHCLNPLAQRTMQNTPDGSVHTVTAPKRDFTNSVAAKDGQKCPHCGRRTPICGICAMQLANPDPKRLNASVAKKLAEEDAIARQAMRCSSCEHTFHGHHARDWFARHKTCPVPSCKCMCASLH